MHETTLSQSQERGWRPLLNVSLTPLAASSSSSSAGVDVLALALKATAAQQERAEAALREARALIRTYQEEVRAYVNVPSRLWLTADAVPHVCMYVCIYL